MYPPQTSFLQFQFFSLFQSYSPVTLKILIKWLSPFYLPAPNILLNNLRHSISLMSGLSLFWDLGVLLCGSLLWRGRQREALSVKVELGSG